MRDKTQFYDADGVIYNPDSCTPLEAAWQNGEVDLRTLARESYPGIRLDTSELQQVKSIGYWDAKSSQNWGLPFHRNEGIEICLLESGSLDFYLNNKSYKLLPNMLTITRPWIPHRLGNPNIGPSKLHWLILDVDVRQPHQSWKWPDWIILNENDKNSLTDILRRNEQPVWQVGNDIKDCFVQIGQLIKNNNKHLRESKTIILINEILIYMLELFTKENPKLNDSLIQSRRSVEIFLAGLEEMAGEPWTLNDMASYCGLGTTQFSKYCQAITNTTPTNYLTQIRLDSAKRLLHSNPDMSITDIAFACGFSSNQYFANVFRKQFKMTPQKYRLMQKTSAQPGLTAMPAQ